MNKLLLSFSLSLFSLHAAENLYGAIKALTPVDGVLHGNAYDQNNPATVYQVKFCYDDPTYTNNCDNPVTANTAGYPYYTCTSSPCEGFDYAIPASLPGSSVKPRDGHLHMIYGKIISQGGTNFNLLYSPWPFTWNVSAGVAQNMWAPNVETSPARLTPGKLAVVASIGDPYSVGVSGTTVCTVSGTSLLSDGAAGYYIQQYGIPCANAYVVNMTTASRGYITQANALSQVLSVTNAIPSSIQAIALAWVSPAQVTPTTASDGPRGLASMIAYGSFMTGRAAEAHNSSTLGEGPINPYFNSSSTAPYTDFGFRPAMFLAATACTDGTGHAGGCATFGYYPYAIWAADFPTLRTIINNTRAATNTNPTNGHVYWTVTSDITGSVEGYVISPLSVGTNVLGANIVSSVLGTPSSPYQTTPIASNNILVYEESGPHWTYTGSFITGAALGYSTRSSTGFLPQDTGNGQSEITSWLTQGCAVAYGNALEPGGGFVYKNPDAAIFVANYRQGQTAIEAVYKSVREPWQGNFVGDPLAAPFSLAASVPGPAPQIAPGGAVNGASFLPGALSPGVVFSIFGSNLGPQTIAGPQLDPFGNVSTSTGGTRVLVNGVPAPVIYSGASQVSAVVPYGTAANAPAQLAVEYQGVQSPAAAINIAGVSPAIFTDDASGAGQGAILNQDGSQNGPNAPAAAGSVVVIFGTGAGVTNPPSVDGQLTAGAFPLPVSSVSVTIAGQPAAVQYAGAAPGLVAGVLQVNAVVPSSVPTGNQPVVIQVGATASQPNVTVAIQ